MTLAPWRSSLSRALHLNRSLVYARYLQLATVRRDGRPANRTIVFRGFLDDSNALLFVTDARSQKADQIPPQPWGDACWYFPKTREQFRLLGQLALVGSDVEDVALRQTRDRLWQNLSDSARLQFAWPHPGYARSTDAEFAPDAPDAQVPLPQFCVLVLDPVEVDHLELRGNPQDRHLYVKEDTGDWSVKAVNP